MGFWIVLEELPSVGASALRRDATARLLVLMVALTAGLLRANSCLAGCFLSPEPSESSPQVQAIIDALPPEEDTVRIGDMLFSRDALEERGGLYGNTWTDGVIYYQFDPGVNSTQRSEWVSAAAAWEAITPLRFEPRVVEPNYILIRNSDRNESRVGMIGGEQEMEIRDWNERFVIAHEIGHAIGLAHEHQRSDRDSYVQINLGNIQHGQADNFTLIPGTIDLTVYDFDSLMHYGQCEFSDDCGDQDNCNNCINHTIDVLPPNEHQQDHIGHYDHISQLDAEAVTTAYDGAEIEITLWTQLVSYGSPSLYRFTARLTYPDGSPAVGANVTLTTDSGVFTESGAAVYETDCSASGEANGTVLAGVLDWGSARLCCRADQFPAVFDCMDTVFAPYPPAPIQAPFDTLALSAVSQGGWDSSGGLDWNPTQLELAAANLNQLTVMSYPSELNLFTRQVASGADNTDLSYDQSGTSIAVSDDSGHPHVFNATNGAVANECSDEFGTGIHSIDWVGSTSVLLGLDDDEGCRVRQVNVSNPSCAHERWFCAFGDGNFEVTRVRRYNANGRVAAVTSDNFTTDQGGSLAVWSSTGTVLSLYGNQVPEAGPFYDCEWLSGGDRVIACGQGFAAIYSATQGAVTPLVVTDIAYAVAAGSDNRIALADGTTLRIFDDAGIQLGALPIGGTIIDLAWNQDYDILAAARNDGLTYLFNQSVDHEAPQMWVPSEIEIPAGATTAEIAGTVTDATNTELRLTVEVEGTPPTVVGIAPDGTFVCTVQLTGDETLVRFAATDLYAQTTERATTVSRLAGFVVSGHVMDSWGNPLPAVQVHRSCDAGDYRTTDETGFWIFDDVLAGSCTFTPTVAEWSFEPANQTIVGSASGVDFVGTNHGPAGACCLPSETCVTANEYDCAVGMGGAWFGEASCDPSPCIPIGACCLPDDSCVLLDSTECGALGGAHLGDGTSCSPDPCGVLGACCLPPGGCLLLTSGQCLVTGGTYRGGGTTCEFNPNQIPDASGGGQYITFNGAPQFGTACLGSSLAIDGNVNYGLIAPTAAQMLQEFTIEGTFLWTGNLDGASAYRVIADKFGSGGSDLPRSWFVWIDKNTRQINAGVFYDNANHSINVVDPDPLPNPMTDCVQFALTVDAGSEIRLYRDGVLKVSAPFPGDVNYAVNSHIGFGNTIAAGGSAPFVGVLDEFRLSNVARTQFDVGLPVVVDEFTVAAWRFDGPCPPPPDGVCCSPDGSCAFVSEYECGEMGGDYQGDGGTCDPSPCPAPGACCLDDGSCQQVFGAVCAAQGGVFHGEGTSCEFNPNQIPDASGGGQYITFNGAPQFGTACLGSSLAIDGNVNYGLIAPTAAQMLQEFTIEGTFLWTGNLDGASAYRVIADKFGSGGSDLPRSWFVWIDKNTRQINAGVFYDNANHSINVVDPDPLPNPMTDCVQFALTVDAGSEIRLYRDGVLKVSAPFPGDVNYAVNSHIGFGNTIAAGGSAPFVGVLDEFRLSNVARTQFDVGLPVVVDEFTVAAWRFDGLCPPPPDGVCCSPDGSCAFVSEYECGEMGGGYQGDGGTCDPSPCPAPGACCLDDGSCQQVFGAVCAAQGGVFHGEGTSCEFNPNLIPDRSGNGHDIDFSGVPEFEFGCLTGGLDVDGMSDYGTVAPTTGQMLQEFTIEAWFRWAENQIGTSNLRTIVEKSGSTPASRSWSVAIDKVSRTLAATVYVDAENTSIVLRDPTPLPSPMAECVHLALVVEPGVSVRLYRDGVLKDEEQFVGSVNYAENAPIGLANSVSGQAPYAGVLEGMRISGVARAEFRTDQPPRADEFTVALWDFDGRCTTSAVGPSETRMSSVELGLPVPNPASGHVSFFVASPIGTRVRIDVHDASGRLVETVVDEWVEPSRLQFEWRPGDVPSGLYLIRMTTPQGSVSRSVILVK